MQTASALYGRASDVEYIRTNAALGDCCSLVGVSNLGKSVLMRAICVAEPASPGPAYVYVDCNQLAERTPRALNTAICRALLARLPAGPARGKTEHVYDEMVHSPDALTAALHFGDALQLVIDELKAPLVLCLDEFDEAYSNLDPQAFLNLRALRDRYGASLTYVTATSRELARLTVNREQGEFYELIVPRVRLMHLMGPEDTRRFCSAFAAAEHVTFSDGDLEFIFRNADGHPGLVQAVCYVLGAVTGAPVRNPQQDHVIHAHILENLAADANVRSECVKIWNDLEPDEREALLHAHHPATDLTPPEAAARRALIDKSMLRNDAEGLRPFAPLFEQFVRQHKLISQPDRRGVYVDVDAGDVFVNGKPVEALTDLEYRLLLFLYGRLDRVCDKYSIVETVWGQEYIDKVDDTRIEKLISRLRSKIEPDPAHPRYLASLRGRGYKLVR